MTSTGYTLTNQHTRDKLFLEREKEGEGGREREMKREGRDRGERERWRRERERDAGNYIISILCTVCRS